MDVHFSMIKTSSSFSTGFSRVVLSLACIGCTAAWIASGNAEEPRAGALARLQADIAYLASDDLQGRDVGSPGIALAGDFIAKRFSELGIKTDAFDGTPFQDFSIPGEAEMGDPENNVLKFTGLDPDINVTLGQDYSPLALGNSGAFSGPLVFAGYGITAPDLGYDDYADVDVKGKVVIVIRKEPQQQMENSIFDGTRSSQYAYFSSKELNAAVHDAAALILVNDAVTAGNSDQLMGVTAAGKAVTGKQIPTLYCKRAVIDTILTQKLGKTLRQLEDEIDGDLKPRSQVLEGVTASGEVAIQQSQIPVRNVVGYLPGTGDLADEFVVVGAHYDHVGMGGVGSLAPGTVAIHNGADDNASGTCTMLEVARRLAFDDSKQRRGLIFMAFTGEEKGLLGSKHYVRNPRWPIEQTVAMVNMDMVGRLADNRLTVYGTGTAAGFEDMIDRANETAQFNLSKQAAGFGPSDHSSFYEVEIPVFHFFTGLHDDYHRPGDDPEKVNYEGMSRVADMVSGIVRELATAETRPAYMKTTAFADVGRRGRTNRSRAILGVQLDLDFQGQGAALAEVPENGPAFDAGLQSGDVIIKIDEQEIPSVLELRKVLSELKPEDKIQVTVRRGEEQLTSEVTLGRG